MWIINAQDNMREMFAMHVRKDMNILILWARNVLIAAKGFTCIYYVLLFIISLFSFTCYYLPATLKSKLQKLHRIYKN